MLRYVEFDDAGELTHVCEVYTTEGVDVEQPRPGMTVEQKSDRAGKVARAIDAAEKATVKALTAKGGRLVLLDAAAALPEAGRDRMVKGKLTRRTDAELAAHRDAQPKPGAQPTP